jgi:hypothetical protein
MKTEVLNMDKGGFMTNNSGRVFRVMEYLDSYASTEQAEHAKAVYTRIKESGYPESYAIVALLHDSLEDGYATKRELVDWLGVSETELVALDFLTRRADQDYVEYIHALKRNDIARAVKYADLYVNIKRCVDDLDSCYSLAGRYIGAWSILKHYEHKLNKSK